MAVSDEKVVIKRGLSKNLPQEKIPGVILITTDTGEMYVDDTSTSRVKVNEKAQSLKTSRAIDGILFDGSSNINHYSTCSTAANTADKVVIFPGYTLEVGSRVTVKFIVANTASNPTLNINNTGSKTIKYRGSSINPEDLSVDSLYEFVYDGSSYLLSGSLSTDIAVRQNAATASAEEYPILLGGSTEMTAFTGGVNKASTLTYNPSTGLLKCGAINAPLDDGAID